MSEDLGHAKRENGHRVNPSLPGLEEGISCALGFIMYCTGSITHIGWRGRIWPSYSIHEQEAIQG